MQGAESLDFGGVWGLSIGSALRMRPPSLFRWNGQLGGMAVEFSPTRGPYKRDEMLNFDSYDTIAYHIASD